MSFSFRGETPIQGIAFQFATKFWSTIKSVFACISISPLSRFHCFHLLVKPGQDDSDLVLLWWLSNSVFSICDQNSYRSKCFRLLFTQPTARQHGLVTAWKTSLDLGTNFWWNIVLNQYMYNSIAWLFAAECTYLYCLFFLWDKS